MYIETIYISICIYIIVDIRPARAPSDRESSPVGGGGGG